MDSADFDKGVQDILSNYEDSALPEKAEWDRLNSALPPTIPNRFGVSKWWIAVPVGLLLFSNLYLGWTVLHMGDQVSELQKEIIHHQDEVAHVGNTSANLAENAAPGPLVPATTDSSSTKWKNIYHYIFSDQFAHSGTVDSSLANLNQEELKREMTVLMVQYLKDNPSASTAFFKDLFPQGATRTAYAERESVSPKREHLAEAPKAPEIPQNEIDPPKGEIVSSSDPGPKRVPETAHPIHYTLVNNPGFQKLIANKLADSNVPVNPADSTANSSEAEMIENLISSLQEQPETATELIKELKSASTENPGQEELITQLEALVESGKEEKTADSLALVEKTRHRAYLDSLGSAMANQEEATEITEDSEKGFKLATKWATGMALGFAKGKLNESGDFNYNPIALKIEWLANDRLGLVSGLSYAGFEWEDHGTVDPVFVNSIPNFPVDQLAQFDETKIYLNLLEIPLEARYYVLPEASFSPFVAVSLKNSIVLSEEYIFKDESNDTEWKYDPKSVSFSISGFDVGAGARLAFGNRWSGILRFGYRKGSESIGDLDLVLDEVSGQFQLMYTLP